MLNLNGNNTVEKKRSTGKPPSSRTQLTPNLSLALWESIDKNGDVYWAWDIDRVNPADEHKPFKTKRLEDLFEVIDLVGFASSAFANSTTVAPDLRTRLGMLANNVSRFNESVNREHLEPKLPANNLFSSVA